MGAYIIKSFRGGLSDYEDKGTPGSFKFGYNLDIRKKKDSLSCGQALIDEGISQSSPSSSQSPSASTSPSASPSATPSPSASQSPSASPSSSPSPSTGESPSPSLSPSASASPSASPSPSSSGSPSPSPSAGLTTVFEDLIIKYIEGRDGYVYGLGNVGNIYRRDSDGYWTRLYLDPDGAIKGGEIWQTNEDGVVKDWLYFATDTLEKRKDLNGDDSWNDVETVGNLTSDDNHTHAIAGGALVITNARLIAYVGYDGTFSNEATDLIPGNLAKTIVERNGRAIIGAVKSSTPSKGVNSAIDIEVPIAQVGNDGELLFSNMSDSVPITRFPGGGQTRPGGVCKDNIDAQFFEWEEGASSWIDKQSVGGLALFGVYNADTDMNGVYSFGRKRKNHPVVMNLEYKLEVDDIGAVINIDDGTTLVSYQDGTDFGVKATDPNNKATAVYEGTDFMFPNKKPQSITSTKQVKLTMDPLPSGTAVEFWYRMNKKGDFVQALTTEKAEQFTNASRTEAIFNLEAIGEIYEPRVVLVPNGNDTPEVHMIETFFE